MLSRNPLIIGNDLILTCVADGFPPPKYTIVYNDSVVSTEQKYLIPEANSWHTMTYECIADNRLGQNSISVIILFVNGKIAF